MSTTTSSRSREEEPGTDQASVPYARLVVSFDEAHPSKVDILRPATLIGSHRGCDVCLKSTTISFIHCLIYLHEGQLFVRDLRSRTGVTVNDEPVQSAPISDGDVLKLGSFRLLVESSLTPPLSGAGTPESKPSAEAIDADEEAPLENPTVELEIVAAQLKQRQTRLDAKETELAALAQQLEQSEQQLEEGRRKLEADSADLEKRSRQLDEQLRDRSGTDGEMAGQQQDPDDDIHQLHEQIDQLTEEQNEIQESRRQIEQRATELDEKEKQLADRAESLRASEAELNARREILDRESSQLTATRQDCDSRFTTLAETEQRLNEEQKQLQGKRDQLQSELSLLAESQQRLQHDEKQIIRRASELDRSTKSLQSESKKMEAAREKLASEQAEWREKTAKLKADQKENARIQKQLLKDTQNLESKSEDFATAMRAFQNDQKQMTRSANQLERAEKKLLNEQSKLEQQRAQLGEQRAEIQKTQAAVKSDSKNLAELRQRIEAERQQLQSDQQTLAQGQQLLDQDRQELQRRTAKIDALATKLDQDSKTLAELKDKLNDQLAELQIGESRLSAERQNQEILQRQLDQLQQRLETDRAAMDEAQSRLAGELTDFEQRARAIEQSENTIRSREAEQQQKQNELDDLARQVLARQEEVESQLAQRHRTLGTRSDILDERELACAEQAQQLTELRSSLEEQTRELNRRAIQLDRRSTGLNRRTAQARDAEFHLAAGHAQYADIIKKIQSTFSALKNELEPIWNQLTVESAELEETFLRWANDHAERLRRAEPGEKPDGSTADEIETEAFAIVVRQLEILGLCTKSEIAESLQELSGENRQEELLDSLVGKRRITRFQANQLLAGNGPALMMGDYLVQDPLSVDSWCEVWKARSQLDGRLVQLRRLRSNWREDARAAAGFHRCCLLMESIRSPHIVPYLDSFKTYDQKVAVLDYAPGRFLGQLLRTGPLRPVIVARLMNTVSQGLAALAERGYIHRHLTPQNIFVTSTGATRLVVFDQIPGITSVEADTARSYQAPEITGGGPVDIRSDLYSLGVISWHMLSGQSPSHEAPVWATVTIEFRDLLEQLLAVDPENRPAQPALVSEALQAIEANLLDSASAEHQADWDQFLAVLAESD